MFCNWLKISGLKTLLATLLLTVTLAANALTWTDPDTGITWTYTKLADGTASLGGTPKFYSASQMKNWADEYGYTAASQQIKELANAVPYNTKGDLIVPDTINGLRVSTIKPCAFARCRNLTSITFSDSIKTTADARFIFLNCYSLHKINLEMIDVSNATNMTGMLSDVGSATNYSVVWDFSGLSKWNVSKVTNMCEMFSSTTQKFRDFEPLKDWNVTNVKNFAYMFYGGSIMWGTTSSKVDLSPLKNWKVSNGTTMLGMFYNINIENTNGLENWDVSNVTDMGLMFANNKYLTNINALQNWNVSKVKRMREMFDTCLGITDLNPLKNWDVSKVKTMSYMFMGLINLTNLTPIKDWDLSSVTDMEGMFYNCRNLEDITILKQWNVSNVTTIASMFKGCDKLSIVDISIWNCESLKEEASGVDVVHFTGYLGNTSLFQGCKSLKQVKLPIKMSTMDDRLFYNSGIEEITLSSNTEKISNYVFQNCNNLKTITLPAQIQTIKYKAFSGCNNLESVYSMATTPPTLDKAAFDTLSTGKINKTLYVKTSALEAYRADPQWSRFAVITDQIPVTIAAGKQYSTLAVDFDADFSETEGIAPYVAAKYYEGRTAAAKVATAYQRAGMPAKAKAAADDNTIRTIVVAQFTDKYIPSRTGDDNFTFHGALIYGKPGPYYYKMGERDYASGNQVTEDWENNYMMPAYETWQLSPTYMQEPENWMCYPKNDSYNFVLKDGRFKYIDNQGSIPRHKAWLSLPAGIVSGTYQEAGAKMAITFEDGDTGDTETTGITFITEQKDRDGNVTYNLAGQQVDDAYKGMVIRNGKTFIKK